MGLAAVIQDDALGVLGQKLDQRLGLGGVARRQGAVAHLHRLVCKTVGKAARPRRGADAVLGHIHPIVQAVEVGPPPQHHRRRSQRAGSAAALLEVEPGVHVQVNGQGSRQAGCQQDQRQHKGDQLLAD